MIVTRTPLRVSFVGGGSDIPAHYQKHGGAVISASISKYIFVTVNKKFDNNIRLSYSLTETVDTVSSIKHNLVRNILEKIKIDGGLEITSIADIPSQGSGLGSSSAFTIGLLHVLHAYQGRYRSQEELAVEACEIEIDICGEPIGKQDQYATALGGMNLIRFNPDDTVTAEPIIFPAGFRNEFQNSMLLFYTGITRSASDVLQQQSIDIKSDTEKTKLICRMADMTSEFRGAIFEANIEWIGNLLHEAWLLKSSISDGISNNEIDEMYHLARDNGAFGGKLLGAGGGGFLLICAPTHKHSKIREALSKYRVFPFKFDWVGSTVVYYSKADDDTL